MEFYADKKEHEHFIKLVEDLSCGIILVMVLAQENIVETWKQIVNFKDFPGIPNEAAKSFVLSLLNLTVHLIQKVLGNSW